MLPINITGAEFSTQEAISVLQPLILLMAGIFLYSWFIFKFYRFLARKDIIKLNLRKYSGEKIGFFGTIFKAILYVIEYLLLFPLFVFFWFIVLALFIGVISSRPFAQILIASMGLVAAIRIAAYYNEDLSKDLAKMIPFALLGIFIIDVKFISFPDIASIFWQIVSMWKNIAYYLILTIVLEIWLRIISAVFGIFKKDKPIEPS